MEYIQYLGWIAFVLYLIGTLCKKPRNSIKAAASAESLNLALYTLSMQWVGALSIGLNVLRSVCAIYASDKVLKYVLIISLSLVWGMTLYFIKFPYDILIACAATCITLAQRNRDNFYGYRTFALLSQFFWVTHSLLIGMHSMAASCLMLMTFNLSTIVLFTYQNYRNTGRLFTNLAQEAA